jgi:CRP-like cAMP-binding protein
MGRSVSPPGGNGRTPELPTPQVKAEYLSLIDIFRELPTDEITRLAVDLPMRTYSSGAVIYAPGEQSDVLFLLKRGTVNIVQQVPGGKRLITRVLQPYTFFGEMGLVAEQFPEWASAQAVDDVLVCLIERSVIERLVLSYPYVGLRLLERMAARLVEAEATLASMPRLPHGWLACWSAWPRKILTAWYMPVTTTWRPWLARIVKPSLPPCTTCSGSGSSSSADEASTSST